MLPKWDEWVEMVPAVSGHQPVTWAWLWSLLNEHRIPLPRLVYLAAYYVSGGDFRSGACVSVLLLALTALLCMAFARRCRGSAPVDAFFPLILLHWGQTQNFFLGITLNFVIPTVLGYLALLIVLSPKPFGVCRGLLWTCCLLGMPLCGMTGVVAALPLTCWLAALGLSRLRTVGQPRREGIAFLVMAAGVLAVIGLYFVDFSWCKLAPENDAVVLHGGLRGRLVTMGTILAMCLGWLGKALWPLAPILLVLLAATATAAVLVVSWRRPGQRIQTSGWLAFMASTLLLVAGVGWGRSFVVGEDLWYTSRYATVSIPVLVAVYLASLVCFSPTVGAWTRGLLATTALAVYGGLVLENRAYPYALTWVKAVCQNEDTFVRAAVNGASSERLVEIVGQFTQDPRGVPCMEMFRSARLGPFGLSERDRRLYLRDLGLNVRLAEPAAKAYLARGWCSVGERRARWTVEPVAVIHFDIKPVVAHRLTVRWMPFVVSGLVDRQRVRVVLNGTEVQTLALDRMEWTSHTFSLPKHLLGPANVLAFKLPDAVSPRQVGFNRDERVLGICVKSLRLD
jgi:hypothetical protein